MLTSIVLAGASGATPEAPARISGSRSEAPGASLYGEQSVPATSLLLSTNDKSCVWPGIKPKGTNPQGCEEYIWLKDSSVMVKIPGKAGIYYIDKFEVTNRQFANFVEATGYKTDAEKQGRGWVYDLESFRWEEKRDVSWRDFCKPGTENHPVVMVSWNDAKAYCDWAGKRLATEDEWEFAARGTSAWTYPWGNTPPTGSTCNFADRKLGVEWADKDVDDGYCFTAPVGSYPHGASPWGCMDMAGNVWEWCDGWYGGACASSRTAANPMVNPTNSNRVLRGGSWGDGARLMSCLSRIGLWSSFRFSYSGFRAAFGGEEVRLGGGGVGDVAVGDTALAVSADR